MRDITLADLSRSLNRLHDLSQKPVHTAPARRKLGIPSHFRPLTERPPKAYREIRHNELKMDDRLSQSAIPAGVTRAEHIVMGRPEKLQPLDVFSKTPNVYKLEVTSLIKPSEATSRQEIAATVNQRENAVYNRGNGSLELDGQSLYLAENTHGELLLLNSQTGKLLRDAGGKPVGLKLKA